MKLMLGPLLWLIVQVVCYVGWTIGAIKGAMPFILQTV